MLTHEAVMWQYVSCIIDGGMSVDDKFLHALPLYHCAQLDVFLADGHGDGGHAEEPPSSFRVEGVGQEVEGHQEVRAARGAQPEDREQPPDLRHRRDVPDDSRRAMAARASTKA